MLSGPSDSYEQLLEATHGDGGDQQRRQHGKEVLRVAQARAGFETLADINAAYVQVETRVGDAASRGGVPSHDHGAGHAS